MFTLEPALRPLMSLNATVILSPAEIERPFTQSTVNIKIKRAVIVNIPTLKLDENLI